MERCKFSETAAQPEVIGFGQCHGSFVSLQKRVDFSATVFRLLQFGTQAGVGAACLIELNFQGGVRT
jgi:hypothetical protein